MIAERTQRQSVFWARDGLISLMLRDGDTVGLLAVLLGTREPGAGVGAGRRRVADIWTMVPHILSVGMGDRREACGRTVDPGFGFLFRRGWREGGLVGRVAENGVSRQKRSSTLGSIGRYA